MADRKFPVPQDGSHARNPAIGRAGIDASSTDATTDVGVYQVPARLAVPADSAARFAAS